MIDENTTGIFVEAAHFDHASIRHTSIRLNLITEAAQRFTKGIETPAMQKAMDRSVQLLSEYAEADGFEKTVIAGETGYRPQIVKETLSHCNGLLGTDFTMDQVVETLKWLDFRPEVNGEEITCHIPSYRIDIEGKADIDEEIVRLIGFDSIGSTLPEIAATVGQLSPVQSFRRTTRDLMKSFGFNEIVTYTLVNDDYARNGFNPLGEPISLAMPMSEARKNVRTNLINSVMEVVQYNEAHQNSDLSFFEISKVYAKEKEDERLAIVLDGSVESDRLHRYEIPGDFYALKGIILTWLSRYGFAGSRIAVKENTMDTEHFHPYRSAEIYLDRKLLGVFGELHPDYAKKFDCKRVCYAELSIEPVLNAKTGRIRFTELPKFPSVSRDIALVVDGSVTAGEILKTARNSGAKILVDCEVFDVYEGEHVAEGQKSVALTLTYQTDHTLRDEEITEAHEKILNNLKKKLNAELRG